MKTILIVGNGFNYMINSWIDNLNEDYIKNLNIGSKEDLKSDISKITVLWKKFNDIFQEIKKNNRNISEEELIRLIYSVIDLFSNLPGLEKIFEPEKIEELKNLFSSFLLDKIREIALEFKQHHESTGYKNLKRVFPTFGKDLNEILKSKDIEYFNIFTTNYDGLLDTLLTNHPFGFIFSDGFSHFDEKNLIISSEYIKNDKLICHLHGSYLYKKEFGFTYKMKSNFLNTEPIMVFNNPDQKEEIIKRDNVLSKYYDILIDNLQSADNLVIFGNSMNNEPHLKNLIKKFGNRESLSVYVCSTSPNKIKEQVEKFYEHNIREINTTSFTTPNEFLKFIKEL